MIGFEEAREIVLGHASPLPGRTVALAEGLGAFLAEPVRAKVDSPAFASSAVDGFAVRTDDLGEASVDETADLRLVGEIRAGDDPTGISLQPGTTLRILTGAPVPDGADAIVMKEDCETEGEIIRFRGAPAEGENVRQQGEEHRQGDLLLEAGVRLTPPVCGLLAGAGYGEASVHDKPHVAILTTGDELATPGEDLRPGRIYESNSVSLSAAVRALGIGGVSIGRAKDDLKATKSAIAKALKGCDVLLTTGGVSVGEYDVVKEALASAGVEEKFWRVAIKPGMPLYFGVAGGALVFGLPGNPVSAMVNFFLFVRPALMRLMGGPAEPLRRLPAILGADVWKRPGRAEFVRGVLSSSDGASVVAPISARGSHMMGGLARADCLIALPEEAGRVLAGSAVEVIPLVWEATAGRPESA